MIDVNMEEEWWHAVLKGGEGRTTSEKSGGVLRGLRETAAVRR